jgi:hypothetical protein
LKDPSVLSVVNNLVVDVAVASEEARGDFFNH